LRAICTYLLFLGPGYPTVSFKFSPADRRCYSNEFWDKIDYNSAAVKDNCALFAPTSYFSGPCFLTVSLKFFCRPPLPWQRILGTKLTITRRPWKIIARGLHLPPIFGPGYPMVSFKFVPWQPLLP